MISTQTCPSNETLRRYAMGQYADEEGDIIEQHLAQCVACEDTLASLDDTRDSLVRHLPLAAGDSEPGPHVGGWLKRLMNGPPEDRSPLPEPAIADASAPSASDFGAYELSGVLGQGGMGVVYEATHRQLGRPVAIKVVSPKLFAARDAQRRFDREIQVLGQLNHPGIVAATDAGRIGEAPYLVMERIDGVDLTKLVRRSGPLSVSEACDVARQVALALAAAHEAGAIHRDVKPSNVMIDRNGQAKLLDFGLAHLTDSIGNHQETSIGRLLGTLDYMAPEQADGKTITPAVDLYGLGATLFFLLTGQPPKSSGRDRTLVQQLRQIIESEATPLKEVRGGIPDGLSDLVSRMLDNDPDGRPNDANEVAEELAQWANGSSEAFKRMVSAIGCAPSEGKDSESAAHSLHQLLGHETTSVAIPQSGSGFGRHWVAMVGLAFFGPLLYFAIVILLQSDNGTVRIESEVPGVTVELVSEDEVVRELKITNDEKQMETKIQSGKYMVRLAEGYDSLVVEPNEIVLSKNETEIARVSVIRRPVDLPDANELDANELDANELDANELDANELDANELDANELDAKDAGAKYMGQPEFIWQARYESEANPVAKIEAATALVTLAADRPPVQRVRRTIEVGGNLLDDAYGRQMQTNIHAVGLKRRYDFPLWPRTEVMPNWDSFLQVAGGQLLNVESSAVTSAISSGELSVAESVFTLVVLNLSKVRDQLKLDQDVTDRIVTELGESWPEPVERVAILGREDYAYHASKAAREDFLDDVRRVGQQIPNSYEEGFARSWTDTARAQQLQDEAFARVVLLLLIDDPTHSMLEFFQARWYKSGEFAYPDQWMEAARKYGEPLWSVWLPVANEWLREHSPQQEGYNSVLGTMSIVLRVRHQDDEWPVEELRNILVQQLRDRYVERELPGPDAPSTHDLLAYLVLAGGELPPFVMDGPPALSNTDELNRYRQVIKKSNDLNQMLRLQKEITRLRSAAPVELLRAAVQSDHFNPRDLLSVMEPLPGKDDVAPPMEPLLVLAIVTKLAGKSEQEDERIAELFFEPRTGRKFLRHIRDATTYPFALQQVALRLLKELRSKAVSPRLNQGVEAILPPE